MTIGRLLMPSQRAAWLVHLAQGLHRSGGLGRRAAVMVRYRLARAWGIHLNPSARVGHVVFPHPAAIVIGSGVVIEDDVVIYQGVTLGGKDQTARAYPTVRRGACLFAGSVVIGNVEIGEGAIVGANSVVTCDVAPGSVVVGAPARPTAKSR